MPLFFDDLTVGQRFSSRETTVAADEIRDFATRYDPQPFHLDAAAAQQSLFGGLVTSGWHTAALTTMRLMVDSVDLAGGHVRADGELTWPEPTRPGDRLR